MENTSREKSYQHIFNYFSKVFSVDVIEYSTKRKKLHLPRIPYKLLTDLLQDATLIFKSEPNIIRINSPVVVVGDIHGSLHDLLRIIKFWQESEFKILLHGDYVDRGNFSLE